MLVIYLNIVAIVIMICIAFELCYFLESSEWYNCDADSQDKSSLYPVLRIVALVHVYICLLFTIHHLM